MKKIIVRCYSMRDCSLKANELANKLCKLKMNPRYFERNYQIQVKTDKCEVLFWPLPKKVTGFSCDIAIGFDRIESTLLTRGKRDDRWDDPLPYILEEYGVKVEE